MTFAPKPPEPAESTVVDLFPTKYAAVDAACAVYQALPVGSKERQVAFAAAVDLARNIDPCRKLDPEPTAAQDESRAMTPSELKATMAAAAVQVAAEAMQLPFGSAERSAAAARAVALAKNPEATPASSVTGFQLVVPETVDPLLVKILSWPRKHESVDEIKFCAFLQEYLRDTLKIQVIRRHQVGAFSVTVPSSVDINGVITERQSTTLFSCHVDTVDGFVAPGVRKDLTYDSNFGLIGLESKSMGSCLGADDGAGVWIMLKMIEAGVPGTYMFHRGEECGGISAKAIAAKESAWLERFDCAVAFDRPRDNEVITHQGGAMCASQKFALALAKALNDNGPFEYKPSNSGVYTDTKEYRRIIAECVNLGVGYTDQHGHRETLDYGHLVAMLDACKAIKWDALPIDRDPTVVDPTPQYNYGGYQGRAYQRPFDTELDESFDGWEFVAGAWKFTQADASNTNTKAPKAKTTKGKSTKGSKTPISPRNKHESRSERMQAIDTMMTMTRMEIEDLAFNDAEESAALIVMLVREVAALNAEINQLDSLLGK